MTERATDDLIGALTADLTPVTPLAPIAIRVCRSVALSLAALVAGAVLLGVRPDLTRMLGDHLFVAQMLFILAIAVLSTIAAFVLSVPGAERRRLVRWLPLLFLGAWTTALVATFAAAGGSAAQFLREPLHPACGLMILALSIVPASSLGVMVRRGAPLELGWSGGLTSLAALGFAALGVQAVCPIPQPAHVLMAHVLVVVAMALAGAAVSQMFPRRAAHRSR